MGIILFRLSVSASALAMTAAMPSVAMAQETLPPAAQTPVAATSGGLEDIVVTARKRAESVQDVPVSVTAISAQTIEARDLTSIEKIAAATPSFSVGRASNGSGAQLTMRGIGSSSTSIGIEQSVATVVDGVYYGQGRTINEGFFDLAAVELLKGPQALFFGKNATAGVVSIRTADPTDVWEFKARAGYEFKGEEGELELVASGPVSETLGVRLALRGSKMWGGYYRNESQPIQLALLPFTSYPAERKAPQEEELLGRLTVKWDPTDRLTATVKASGTYNEVNNNAWNYVPYNCFGGTSTLGDYACTDNFITRQNNMPREMAAVTPYARDGELYNRYKSVAVTGTVNYEFDNVTLTSVSNYNWNNNRFNCACEFQANPLSVWATENSSYRAVSSEFRALTTFDSPVNLMVGGYYQDTKRTFDQFISFSLSDNGPAAGPMRYLDAAKTSFTKGETLAAFGQVTWQIIPTLELAGGVRYSHETKDSSFVQPFISPAFSGAWAQGRVTTGNQTFNDWSPEATITWKPVDGILVYGAYKTAYKSGGFSNGGVDSLFGNPAVDLMFDREKARGFEAGIKTTLFDQQLRLNLGAYTYKYIDLQVDFFNSAILAYETITADARTKGVELEFEYAPYMLEGLYLRGAINYNKARYTDFPMAPCYSGQTTAGGCNLLFNPALGGFSRQNLDGAPLSVAPKWTGSLGVSYETPVTSDLMAGFNIDTRYSSSYLVSGFAVPFSRQGKYALLDAGVRIGDSGDRWEFAIIGKNLTNKQYFSGVNDAPNTGSGTGTPGGIYADQMGYGSMPRTVMAQVTVRY
ncbi:MAG: TonB-dependent receptor [Sphingomonadaceae bacterium]